MDLNDVRSWTYGFIERNETECANYIVSKQNIALEAMRKGNYNTAASLFGDIAHGLEMLSCLDKEYYEPPLYAALFYLTRIEAFGLKNRDNAIMHLKRACSFAQACSTYDTSGATVAREDLAVMKDLLSRLENGEALSTLKDEFAGEFTVSSGTATPSETSTTSGKGCFIFVVAIALIVGLFFVMTNIKTVTDKSSFSLNGEQNSEMTENDDGLVTMQTKYFSVKVPKEWEEICVCDIDEKSISFSHRKSYNDYGGYLFSIEVQDPSFFCYAGDPKILGGLKTSSGEKFNVWLLGPSDVPCSEENYEEYSKCMAEKERIVSSLSINEGYIFTQTPYAIENNEEYINICKNEADYVIQSYRKKTTKGSITSKELTNNEVMQLYEKANNLFCINLFSGWKSLGVNEGESVYHLEKDGYTEKWICAGNETFVDLHDMCEQYFSCMSDELVQEFLCGEFALINGKLYYPDSGDWGDEGVKQEKSYKVLKTTDGYMVVVSVNEFRDYDNPEKVTNVVEYKFPCIYEDGAWVFSHIEWVKS